MALDMVKDGHLGGYVRGGDPGTWCPNLWQWLVATFEIRSVLDVGCGEGQSTRFFRDLGCEVIGVDGCRQAIADSVIPECSVLHDFCEGPFIPSRPVDLVWSCEFVEHVEERFLDNLLRTFASARKAVAMTHAFPGQRGHHHVNCQKSAYWIRHLERSGLVCHVASAQRARTVSLADHPRINHFARSGLLFLREDEVRQPGQDRSLTTWWKAARIHWGFRWSSAYRRQLRTYRAEKRRRRALARHTA
jgi:SAM-dependent methyltransferase